jgi:hypothetical protein
VKIPLKNVTISKRGQYTYVFYLLNHGWDFSKKKRIEPTLKIIGTPIMEMDGYMIPNKNYETYFLNNQNKKESLEGFNDRISFGPYLLLNKIAHDLGCLSALKNAYKDYYQIILAYAQYLIMEQNSNSDLFEYFCSNNYSGLKQVITTSTISQILESGLTLEHMEKFTKHWIKQLYSKNDPLADTIALYLDTTYYDPSHPLQLSNYNKYNKNIKINSSIFISTMTSLPIGPKNQRGYMLPLKAIKDITSYGLKRGLSNIFVVADKGLNSKQMLEALNKEKFIIICKETDNETINQYSNYVINTQDPSQRLENFNAWAMSQETQAFFGLNLRLVVFEDQNKRKVEEQNFNLKLNIQEKILSKYKKYESWMSQYQYFIINFDEKKKITSIQRNLNYIFEQSHKLGKFIILTNDLNCSNEIIYRIIRQKEEVDNLFDIVKNDYNIQDSKLFHDLKFNSSLFCAFIGTILKNEILRRAKPFFNSPKYLDENFHTLIARLRKIVIENKEGQWNIRFKLTNPQIDILKCFNISEAYLDNEVSKLNTKFLK